MHSRSACAGIRAPLEQLDPSPNPHTQIVKNPNRYQASTSGQARTFGVMRVEDPRTLLWVRIQVLPLSRFPSHAQRILPERLLLRPKMCRFLGGGRYPDLFSPSKRVPSPHRPAKPILEGMVKCFHLHHRNLYLEGLALLC